MKKRRSPQRKNVPERRLKAGDPIPPELLSPFPRPRRRSSTGRPSAPSDEPWLFAYRQRGDYPMRTGNSGKWLVFVDRALVDEVWGKIKEATEEGRLGGSSKVSTPRRHQPSGRATSHVICVYTYDFTDEADVRQVREALRQLGIVVRIPYKADQDTRSGKYAALGDRNLSKYFE